MAADASGTTLDGQRVRFLFDGIGKRFTEWRQITSWLNSRSL